MNRTETRNFVDDNGIVMLKADKTTDAPDVDELLAKLGNTGGSIPFYAVFPADSPTKPLTLGPGPHASPEPMIELMRRAGPSRDVSTVAKSSPE